MILNTLLCKVTFPTVSLQNALVVPRAALVTYTVTEKAWINKITLQKYPHNMWDPLYEYCSYFPVTQKVLSVFLELSGIKWNLFYIIHRFQFKIPFKIPTKNHLLTGRCLAESSFTNNAAVANISSPWTACSGCKINKNDKIDVTYSVETSLIKNYCLASTFQTQ